MSLNRFTVFSSVPLVIIFSASLVFAAADQSNQPHHTAAEINSTSTATSVDTTSEYTQGVQINFGVQTIAPTHRESFLDTPTDLAAKYFHEPITLPFYNGGKTTWSIASLSDKFSSNPMTDIKNLTDIRNVEVLIQFKF